MTLKEKIQTASILGSKAFNEGKTSVPWHDSNVRELLSGMGVGEGSYEIMKAWGDSWRRESFKTDISL